jgi:hypothetical protein
MRRRIRKELNKFLHQAVEDEKLFKMTKRTVNIVFAVAITV